MAIDTLYENEIINGYPDETFNPNGNISFAESSKIIVETLLDHTSAVFNFAQEPSLSDQEEWYQPYILALNEESPELGIYGELDPAHLTTRGEMAEYIYWLHY